MHCFRSIRNLSVEIRLNLKMSSKHLSIDSNCPSFLNKDVPRFYTMRFCPFAQRVSLVASIKNIPLDVVYINTKDKPTWYVEKSPSGKVPALELNDHVIVESLICSQFLDDLYPNKKLTATDPYQKARHSLLLEEFGKFSATVKNLKNNYSEETVNQCLELLEPFEKELAKEKSMFFGGNQVGMLDLMIWPWFERIPPMKSLGKKLDITEDRFPFLCKWQQKMIELDDIKKISINEKNYINFIKTQAAGNPVFDP